jgi:hypothetical protein
MIGTALVRRLGVDGQLDPSHDTIAGDVGCCSRTVRRALEALKGLGLVLWQRRLVRVGWRTAQTSNAYLLALTGIRQNSRSTLRRTNWPTNKRFNLCRKPHLVKLQSLRQH